MLDPPPGGGYLVSTHMLNSAASSLHGSAEGIAELRDAFNPDGDAPQRESTS